LPDEQKALRLQAYQEFIQCVDDDPTLLNSVETGDETWYFQYDPQAKYKAWNGTHQALQNTKYFNFKSQKTHIIYKEFVPPGQMVNKEYFLEIFSRLFQRISRVKTSAA
jgi:hypothetical protein